MDFERLVNDTMNSLMRYNLETDEGLRRARRVILDAIELSYELGVEEGREAAWIPDVKC
jgi:hypothetical protein